MSPTLALYMHIVSDGACDRCECGDEFQVISGQPYKWPYTSALVFGLGTV